MFKIIKIILGLYHKKENFYILINIFYFALLFKKTNYFNNRFSLSNNFTYIEWFRIFPFNIFIKSC